MTRYAIWLGVVLFAVTAMLAPAAEGSDPAHADRATGELNYLPCESSSAQAFPSIRGDIVVYQQFEQTHWDVYLCNIADRSSHLLTAGSHTTSEMHPQIFPSLVTWETYTTSGTFIGLGVYHLDGDYLWAIDANLPMNSSDANLWDAHWNQTTSPAHAPEFIASEMSFDDDQFDIYIEEIATSRWLRVTYSSDDQRHPSVDGRIVVFQDNGDDRWRIQYFVLRDPAPEPQHRITSAWTLIVVASGTTVLLFAVAHMRLRGAWWYLSAFSPLYSRLNKHKLLENEKREQVYSFIRQHPGHHFRGIMSDLGISNGALVYHLRTLEREGYIRSKKEGKYRRYFPTLTAPVAFEIAVQDGEIKQVTPLLTESQQNLLDAIRAEPGLHQSELAMKLGVSRQALHYNLNVLKKQNIARTERDGRVVRVYEA